LGQTLTLEVREICTTPPSSSCPIDATWTVEGPNAANAGEFFETQGSTVRFATLGAGTYTLRATATDGTARYGTRTISLAELEFDSRVRVTHPGGADHDAILGADIVQADQNYHLAHSVRGRLSALARYDLDGSLDLTEDVDPSPYPATEQEALLDLGLAPDGSYFVVTDPPDGPRTITRFDASFSRVAGFVPPSGYAYLPAIAVDSTGVVWAAHGTAVAGVVRFGSGGSVVGGFELPAPLDGNLCALALAQSAAGVTAVYAATRAHLLRLTPDGAIDPTFAPFPFGGEIQDVAIDGLGRVFVALQQIPDGQSAARGAILVLNGRGRIVQQVDAYTELVVTGGTSTGVERNFRHPMSVASDRSGILWVYEDLTASATTPNARLVELNPETALPPPSITVAPTWWLVKPGWRRHFSAVASGSPDFTWTAFNGDSVAGDGFLFPFANTGECDFVAPPTPGTYAIQVQANVEGVQVRAEASVTVSAFNFGFGGDVTTPGNFNHSIVARLDSGGGSRFLRFKRPFNNGDHYVARYSQLANGTSQELRVDLADSGSGSADYSGIAADRHGRAYFLTSRPSAIQQGPASDALKLVRWNVDGTRSYYSVRRANGTEVDPLLPDDEVSSSVSAIAAVAGPNPTDSVTLYTTAYRTSTNGFGIVRVVIDGASATVFDFSSLSTNCLRTDPLGRAYLLLNQSPNFRVRRLMGDGSLDPEFVGPNNVSGQFDVDAEGLLYVGVGVWTVFTGSPNSPLTAILSYDPPATPLGDSRTIGNVQDVTVEADGTWWILDDYSLVAEPQGSGFLLKVDPN